MAFLSFTLHDLFLVFLGILLLVFCMIVSVLAYGFYQYKKVANTQAWIEIIEQKIINAILNGFDTEESKSFKNLVKKNDFRELFLEKLVESSRKFSGAAALEITKLFENYGLENEAFKKLEQNKKHIIVRGIQELTEMNVTESLQRIIPFLSHSSRQVYQEAQYAVVRFEGFEGLRFLDNTTHKISEWQQLRLLRSVIEAPDSAEQMIKKWLQSPNSSVVIFSLRLLSKFQILSLYNDVRNLIEHSSSEIKIYAVQTMESLENPLMVEDILKVYDKQPFEVQYEMLKALKTAKDKECIPFFKEQLFNHSLSKVKITAAEALLTLGLQDYLRTTIANDSASEELIKVVKHTLQDKIC